MRLLDCRGELLAQPRRRRAVPLVTFFVRRAILGPWNRLGDAEGEDETCRVGSSSNGAVRAPRDRARLTCRRMSSLRRSSVTARQ